MALSCPASTGSGQHTQRTHASLQRTNLKIHPSAARCRLWHACGDRCGIPRSLRRSMPGSRALALAAGLPAPGQHARHAKSSRGAARRQPRRLWNGAHVCAAGQGQQDQPWQADSPGAKAPVQDQQPEQSLDMPRQSNGNSSSGSNHATAEAQTVPYNALRPHFAVSAGLRSAETMQTSHWGSPPGFASPGFICGTSFMSLSRSRA